MGQKNSAMDRPSKTLSCLFSCFSAVSFVCFALNLSIGLPNLVYGTEKFCNGQAFQNTILFILVLFGSFFCMFRFEFKYWIAKPGLGLCGEIAYEQV